MNTYINLKLFKTSTSATIFNLACWIPAMLFCTHLLISIRNPTAFFGHNRKPFICLFILLLILCWFIREVTSYLDKHEPILNNYLKRLIKQFLFGFLLPLSGMLILAMSYDNWINGHAIQINFLLKEFSIVVFILYFLNGIYIAISLDKQFSIANAKRANERLFDDKFLVYHRGYYVRINLTEVAMVYQSERINWVITFNGEKYILDLSLKEANHILKSHQFFTVTRTQIIHKDIIEKFRPGTFGKIELKLTIKGISTTVSKDKAARFRKWFNSKNEPSALRDDL